MKRGKAVAEFKANCRRCSGECDPNKIDSAAEAVYKMVVEKIVHARFGVVFNKFKFDKILAKEQISLRDGLKVAAAGVCKTKRTKKGKQTKVATSNATPNPSQTNRKRTVLGDLPCYDCLHPPGRSDRGHL